MREQRRLDLRSGLNLEIHLGDDAQRAKRADVQLHQVISGDVLHHLATGSGQLPRRVGDGDADDPVAHRAVARAPEAVGVGRQHPAYRGPLRMGRLQR